MVLFGEKRKRGNESKSKSTKKMKWDEWTKSSEAKDFRQFEKNLEKYIKDHEDDLHKNLGKKSNYDVDYGIEFLIRYLCVREKNGKFKFKLDDNANLLLAIFLKEIDLETFEYLGDAYADVKNDSDWLRDKDLQEALSNFDFAYEQSVESYIRSWKKKSGESGMDWKRREICKLCRNRDRKIDVYDLQYYDILTRGMETAANDVDACYANLREAFLG